MQIIDHPDVWRARADSVWDVQDWLKSTPYNWSDRAPHDNARSRNWTLGHSYEDVQRFAREGWEEGVRLITEALRPPVNYKSNSWRYDIAGEQPDVPRYLSGDPQHMRRRGHDNSRRPVVSIFVNNWINAMITAPAMVNYGAAMTAWIDRIETSGKRVELVVGTIAPKSAFGACEKRIMSATWVVKHAQDPLDLSALAFSLAHPGASRRFGWAMWGHSCRKTDKGFGMALDWDIKPEYLIDPHPQMLMIRGLNGQPSRCLTFDDAMKFTAKQLNDACERMGLAPVAVMEEDEYAR